MNRTVPMMIMLGGFSIPAMANGYTGEELASQAKISLDEARAIALKSSPGQIKDQEFEKEAGGSGLRYSFDIVLMGQMREVGIDAVTGKILEDQAEGPNPD